MCRHTLGFGTMMSWHPLWTGVWVVVLIIASLSHLPSPTLLTCLCSGSAKAEFEYYSKANDRQTSLDFSFTITKYADGVKGVDPVTPVRGATAHVNRGPSIAHPLNGLPLG